MFFIRAFYRLPTTLGMAVICMNCFGQNVNLDSLEELQPHKVAQEISSHLNRNAVHITDPGDFFGNNEDKLVIVEDIEFDNGTIEVSLAGAPSSHAGENARGFVGVAFHVSADVSSFEAFYLRPTNGRANDQLRRNHSSQYISYPDHPWHRLREESPGMNESYVDLVPGEWMRVRIEVEGARAQLYVNGAEQPSLIVNDLKLGGEAGAIGLWIGPGTDAYFSDLVVNKR